MSTTEILSSGWTAALLNHLWQSTAVALLAWLLTLALRNNSARVRYAVWLLASIKFLLPFQFLTAAGSRFSRPAGTHGSQLYFFVEEFTRPIHQAAIAPTPSVASASPINTASLLWICMAAVWLSGFVVLLLKWISGWQAARRMTAAAEPMRCGREFDALSCARGHARVPSPIRLLLSPAGMEPGIFGLIRPVLLWPAGLSEHLDDAQIETIMAHEVEHVRRRDNLTSAIHAFVEALFWFHPLVRWMSARLSEEREQACDERVLEQNARPEAYAESILKVCSFCMEPAAACVSGVSGADLKKRILRIMTQRSGAALSAGRKCLLCAAGLLLIAAPVGFGVLHGQSAPTAPGDTQEKYAHAPDLPKFDVASIKPSSPDAVGFMLMMRPTGVELKSAPVQTLLQLAFGVEPDRIVGAPDWVRSKRYNIEAKVKPEDAPKMDKLKGEQKRAMMLPLLEERFGLKYHHESRELPMYALVVAKGGPKLIPSKPGEGMPPPDGRNQPLGAPNSPTGGAGPVLRVEGPPGAGNHPVIGEGMRMTPGNIRAHGGTTDFLAHVLSGTVGRTVVDKTGLTGNYDFSLTWTPDENMRGGMGGPQGGAPRDAVASDPTGPSLFTALQEQLGLKLESQKGAVDVIVIDHIDLPTEN